MATVNLNPEFEALLAGLETGQIDTLSLDFQNQLDNFSLRDDLLIGNPVLTSNGITAQFESLDPFDTTPFTVSISGSGIAPSGSFDALEQALENSTATGALNQVRVDYGSQTILQFDIAPGSLTLSSGNQSLELTGGFPVTLSDIVNVAQIVSGESEGSLAQYDFTGFALRDGGETLASLQVGDDFVLSLEGYTLTATDVAVDIDTLQSFLIPGQAQLVPDITLFDATGQVVTTGVTAARNAFGGGFDNEGTVVFDVPEQGGTFYVQVGATGQIDTGLYELYSSFWGVTGTENQPTSEDAGDAPTSTATPYSLNSGADFSGMLDATTNDTADWVRIDLPAPVNTQGFSNYSAQYRTLDGQFVTEEGVVVLSGFGTGQPEPVLRNLDGISFSGLTVTTPDGTEIVTATDVESFAAFLDALDAELDALAPDLPDIGGLGLAFATGDPHLLTHDGLDYDFHAAGEYVLMRATNGQPVELQARMEPAGEGVTANTSAALRLGNETVVISATGQELLVNGEQATLNDGATLSLGAAQIARDGNSYRISIPDSAFDAGPANSIVQVDVFDSRIDIGVGLTDFWQGNVEGLLGDFNGTIRNDLRVAGTDELVSFPLQYGDTDGNIGLYGSFRESWRVTDETTLFTYQDGFGPDSYYLPDYPGQIVTLDDFSGVERAAAEAAATNAGLTPGSPAFENAVLDLLITGDDSFLESAQTVQDTLNRIGATPDQTHTPEVVQGSGILDQLQSLSGSVSSIHGGGPLDNTTVTFTREGSAVRLTRETDTGNSFNFRLSDDASGRIEATRDYDLGAGDPSISALDALDVLRLAVGLAPSFGPAQAQNYIAADINGDGQVTALDALEVLRAAVGLESAHAPEWVFFDAATDWDGVAASRESVNAPDTGIDLSAVAPGADLALTGILLGNMDAV